MIELKSDPETGRMKVIVASTEQEAWDILSEDEMEIRHSEAKPEFLYRGAKSRHFRRWPPEDKHGLTKHQYELDSLIPRDYWDVEKIIEEKGDSAVPAKSSDCAAIFRSVMTYACIAEHGMGLTGADHDEIMKWLEDCIAGKFGEKFDAPGSVGQHYGFHTCYLDATSSLKVATWFATRDFSTEEYIGAGDSVIYRIKLPILEDCCEKVNTDRGYSGSDRVRYVDIRSTPSPLGKRAKNQSGWSLIRFECPWILLKLIKKDGILAVVFPRTAGPCEANNLTKDFIAPPGERLAQIFEEVKSGSLFSLVRQQYIDEQINSNPECIACASYRISLRDNSWKDWLF